MTLLPDSISVGVVVQAGQPVWEMSANARVLLADSLDIAIEHYDLDAMVR
jgi:hypothetical protein